MASVTDGRDGCRRTECDLMRRSGGDVSTLAESRIRSGESDGLEEERGSELMKRQQRTAGTLGAHFATEEGEGDGGWQGRAGQRILFNE